MTEGDPHPAGGASAAPTIVGRLDGALVSITGAMATIGVFALIVAIAVVVGDIFWRRLGGGSFIGSVDLTQLSVMIAVSWSIPYTFATGGHVVVDLLSQSFGPRATRALDICASLIGAAIMALLCRLSAGRASEVIGYGDVSQDLAIPMAWYWAFLVSGLAVSVIVCLARAGRLILRPGG